MMTEQGFGPFVIGKRRIAARTARRCAAVAAHHEGIRPAAVQEQNRLLAGIQRGVQLGLQAAAEYAAVAGAQFLAHVHDLHRRHFGVCRPVLGAVPHQAARHFQQSDAAALRRPVGFKARRGAAQDQHAVRQISQTRRHAPRIVEDRMAAPLLCVLLIRGLVLLVDDDQPQPRQRRKQRCAAHDHVELAFAHLAPHVVTLARLSPEESVAAPRKAAGEAGHRLRRRRDPPAQAQSLRPWPNVSAMAWR